MRPRFVVIGDLINDIVATPRGGLQVEADTTATFRPRPGGSGANTAAWLGALGAPVDFIGAVGAADREQHEGILREAGVTPHLQAEIGLPTGTVVVFVDGDRRTMLTERGANQMLDTAALTDELLAGAALVHLSAYSFLDGFGVRGARDVVDRASARSVPVAVNLGSASYISRFGVDRFAEATEGAALLFPNLAEGELLTGERDAERILAALLTRHETVAVTLGAEGVLAGTRGQDPVRVGAPHVRVVDPTGAGDAFAAGFLERWVRTRDLAASAQAGVLLAGRAIVAVGGRPAL